MKQTHKSSFNVFASSFITGLGGMSQTYALVYMNPSLGEVNRIFNIPLEDQAYIDGLITSLACVGGTVGSLFSDKLLQRYSPRQAMIVIDIIAIISALIGVIPYLPILYISRLFLGLQGGLNSAIVPNYNRQLTPLGLRGTIGVVYSIQLNIGILIALVLGFGYANDEAHTFWRVVFLFPIIFSVIRVVLLNFYILDEPPQYYVQMGDYEKAKQVLSNIYHPEFVKGELTEVEIEVQSNSSADSSSFLEMFTKPYKRRLLAGCFGGFIQQACGISAVVFYSTQIFQTVSNDVFWVNALNFLFGLSLILVCTWSGKLMLTMGRKELLLKSDIYSTITLIFLGCFSYLQGLYPDQKLFPIIISIGIFVYVVAYNIGLGPVPWVYHVDLGLPQKGVQICVSFLWFLCAVVGAIFPTMVEKLGIHNCFFVFAFLCIICYYLTIVLVQETKDRNVKSVEALFCTPKTSLLVVNPDIELPQVKK